MKWLILLMLLVSNIVYSQWNYEDIERLESEGAPASEIIYAIKINEGLYSMKQFPYIMKDLDGSLSERNWKVSIDLINWANWILTKNIIVTETWRAFQTKILMTSIPIKCLEIEGLFYTSNTYECTTTRKFIADCYIIALNLQQQMYEHTKLQEDLENIILLAKLTERTVYGVDGDAFKLRIYKDEIFIEENNSIREEYRPNRYKNIKRRAERELAGL